MSGKPMAGMRSCRIEEPQARLRDIQHSAISVTFSYFAVGVMQAAALHDDSS